MSKNISIKKTVYNKQQLTRVVNREFSTFIQPVEEVSTITVEDFFRLYDELYYEIPPEGEVNSHQYLIEKSSLLVDFDKNTEDIQPLLEEIATLREQLLQANQTNIDLQLENAQNGNKEV